MFFLKTEYWRESVLPATATARGSLSSTGPHSSCTASPGPRSLHQGNSWLKGTVSPDWDELHMVKIYWTKLEDEPLTGSKTISYFLYSYYNFFFLQRYCIKVASFFVNGATVLQMFVEVIQYPLTTTLEGNQYPLAKDQKVMATLWQICAIYKSCQFPLRNL